MAETAPAPAPAPSASKRGRLAELTAATLVKLRWFVIAFWAAAVISSLFLLPPLSGSGGSNSLSGLVPDDTPAVASELRSVEIFGFPLLGRTAIVQRDPEGTSVYDQARAVVAATAVTRKPYPGLEAILGALPLSNSFGLFPGSRERDTTGVTYLLFDPSDSFGVQTRAAERYADTFFGPRDSVIGVSGSVPARGAQGDLIRDALPKVELYTLLAIMIIVGIALRSAIAPLVALVSAGIAYVMTLRVSGMLAELLDISAPSELEPVVVALLLGVVTDYVVFYLTAQRRELALGKSRLDAARVASSRFGPIVLVAGLAVAAGTGALLVATSLFFRALGPALVVTVLIGLVVAVTLVPALMAVLGRWSFWPTRPGRAKTTPNTQATDGARGDGAGDGETGDDEAPGSPGPGPGESPAPRRVALLQVITASRRRSAQVVAGCVAVLAIAALPLTNLSLGVSFVGSLPSDSGVRQAADAAREGFAPGILSPTTVLLEGDDLDRSGQALAAFGRALERQPGVAGVLGPGDVGRRLQRDVLVTRDGTAARYLVVLDDPALGGNAIATIDLLQERIHPLLTSSGLTRTSVALAGDSATAAFIVDQTTNDLLRIAVAALAANLLMLLLFLRALVAALYLLVGGILSLAAALGLTSLVFGALDPGAGLTFYVPFAVAVLLLAFGSDYNIFAVGSIWDEARRRPLDQALMVTMPSTIGAIFVAGLTLAASFGLLGVVPLVPFRQLAFAMAVGIMIDVVVVRSLLLPALLTLVGPISAWPSRLLHRGDDPA